eukprot:4808620-Alexandrium_andersonii.AAC.1
MSASLVGSEMCIRDSPSPCRTTRRQCFTHGWLRVIERRRALAGGGSAVSYTHLTLPTICSV